MGVYEDIEKENIKKANKIFLEAIEHFREEKKKEKNSMFAVRT